MQGADALLRDLLVQAPQFCVCEISLAVALPAMFLVEETEGEGVQLGQGPLSTAISFSVSKSA